MSFRSVWSVCTGFGGALAIEAFMARKASSFECSRVAGPGKVEVGKDNWTNAAAGESARCSTKNRKSDAK